MFISKNWRKVVIFANIRRLLIISNSTDIDNDKKFRSIVWNYLLKRRKMAKYMEGVREKIVKTELRKWPTRPNIYYYILYLFTQLNSSKSRRKVQKKLNKQRGNNIIIDKHQTTYSKYLTIYILHYFYRY